MAYQQSHITSNDRRLGIELTKLIRNNKSITINLIDDSIMAICLSIDIDNVKCDININLTNKYPFHPPIVMINKLHYDFYLKELNKNININKIFKTITNLDSNSGSITTSNNWYPGVWLIHIIDEIKDVLKSRRKAYQVYYSRKICENYLVHDLPLEVYL